MPYGFGCGHSESLQCFFEIETRGIDFINNQGKRFEFKESWAKRLNQMFFKIPERQLLSSDYIVFCVWDKEFYIHSSEYLHCKYNFDNKEKHCCLRYTTIKRNYLSKFSNYMDLKTYIEVID